MNKNTGKVLHDLLKKGWIDRIDDSLSWTYLSDDEVREELDLLGEEMNFECVSSVDRIYIVPTQDNDLFLKNNQDYRKDIKAENEAKKQDLYLLNYMAIYLVFIFFKGEGKNPQVRDSITKDKFIEEFTEHCREYEGKNLNDETLLAENIGNFSVLANAWLRKTTDSVDSKTITSKFGCLNKILMKLKADGLFEENKEERKIYPSRKLKDLISYFLRKERIAGINNYFQRGLENATNK